MHATHGMESFPLSFSLFSSLISPHSPNGSVPWPFVAERIPVRRDETFLLFFIFIIRLADPPAPFFRPLCRSVLLSSPSVLHIRELASLSTIARSTILMMPLCTPDTCPAECIIPYFYPTWSRLTGSSRDIILNYICPSLDSARITHIRTRILRFLFPCARLQHTLLSPSYYFLLHDSLRFCAFSRHSFAVS